MGVDVPIRTNEGNGKKIFEKKFGFKKIVRIFAVSNLRTIFYEKYF